MLLSPILALSLLRLPQALALPHQDNDPHYSDNGNDLDEDWSIIRELYEADAAQAQYISPLRIYSDQPGKGELGDGVNVQTAGEGPDVSSAAVVNNVNSTNKTKPYWACDVRSWVRAPDMAPGLTVPAEVRLTMNGSACADVEGWSVGLALKERGAMKVQAPGAVFPMEPQWSDDHDSRPGNIYMDTLDLWDDVSYDQEYREYQKALADPALWIVKGVERVAFDAKLEMPAIQDPTDVDVVIPFYAHCPNTNLPPVLDSSQTYTDHGPDGRFISSESMFNYRVMLHLSNGTTIEQMAGQAGFTPRPKPESERPESVQGVQHGLMSTKRPTEGREDRWDPAPACDRGNLARFNVSVTTKSIAVAGQNHTLNLHLTRSGNGSEYPSNIDLSLAIEPNHTWALAYTDYETYVNATRSNDDMYGWSYSWNMRNFFSYPRILGVKSDAMLKREQEAAEKRREMGRGIWPGDRSPNSVRVELDGEGDVWDVEVELPIPSDAFPSFQRTLEQLEPTIQMRLNTYFRCATQEDDSDDGSAPHDAESDKGKRKVDDEWQEYSLPVVKNKTSEANEMWRYMGQHHRGTVHLTILGPPPLTDDSDFPAAASFDEGETAATHYLDPTALAPILTLSSSRPPLSAFPLLDQEIVQEEIENIRQSKYSWPTNRLLCANLRNGAWDGNCWARGNTGGSASHAAKVWRRKERSGEEAQEER